MLNLHRQTQSSDYLLEAIALSFPKSQILKRGEILSVGDDVTIFLDTKTIFYSGNPEVYESLYKLRKKVKKRTNDNYVIRQREN